MPLAAVWSAMAMFGAVYLWLWIKEPQKAREFLEEILRAF